ncbi:hypothetical protein GJAV_G00244160 [Gymnothorax javanicus]|nr:hypothetical protein GJAV_G00244160 [Gymnothorax javanicus]
MLGTNDKNFPALKTANANSGNKLFFHSYAASSPTPMDTPLSSKGNAGNQGTRRSLQVTPTKLPPTKKLATKTEPSLADILAAIKGLDDKVEDFGKQFKESSAMFASIIQRVDLNSVEITKCKSKVELLEREHLELKKENTDLKEKILEAERYKHRWNLRLSGLKEEDDENIRKKIKEFLLEIFSQFLGTPIKSVNCLQVER